MSIAVLAQLARVEERRAEMHRLDAAAAAGKLAYDHAVIALRDMIETEEQREFYGHNQAARILGISPRQLGRKAEEYGIGEIGPNGWPRYEVKLFRKTFGIG